MKNKLNNGLSDTMTVVDIFSALSADDYYKTDSHWKSENLKGVTDILADKMGFSDDMIRLAYEKTVMNTGKVAFNYMNSILKDWAEKGIKTPADTEKEAKPQKEINSHMPKTRFSSYSQNGSYTEDELETLISLSSVRVNKKEGD